MFFRGAVIKFKENEHLVSKIFINKVDCKKFKVNFLKIFQPNPLIEEYEVLVYLETIDKPKEYMKVTLELFHQVLIEFKMN